MTAIPRLRAALGLAALALAVAAAGASEPVPPAGVQPAMDNPVLRQEADYPCREASGAFDLSGRPEDWSGQGALPLFLAGNEHAMLPDWEGPDDVAAVFYLLWNREALWVAARVRDRHFHDQADAAHFYRGSGIQLAFDPADDTILPGYDGNDVELGLGRLAGGEAAAHAYVGGLSGAAGRWPDVRVRVTDTAPGERFYEAAIPWSRLAPFAPERNRAFGFDALYNANRDGKRRGWLHWTPGVGEEKLAFLFRNVRLVGAGEGRGEALVATDRAYYASGDTATLHLFLPTDRDGEAAGTLTVKNGDRAVSAQTFSAPARPGGTEVRIPYGIGRLRGDGLDAAIAVRWPGGEANLTAELLNLSAAGLETAAQTLAERAAALRARLDAAAASGTPVDYPRASLAVADITLKARRADLKDAERIRRYALLPKIRRQFKFLETLLSRAEAELGDPAAAAPNRRVPRPDLGRLAIRDGAFFAGDQPVLLIGPHTWWDAYKDLDTIAELGFNLVGGTLIAGDVTPAPGVVKLDYAKRIARHLDELAARNLAFDFLISPHPTPDGWVKAHPEMKRYPTGGWINATLYEPATRRMIEEMWAALLPVVRDHPHLASLNLVNEWSFGDGIKTAHPRMLERFRDFLRAEYRDDLAALNARWRRNETAFDAIDPLSFPRATPGAFYDWERFRRAEGLENLAFLRETARRHAPAAACQVKTIAVTDLSMTQYTPVGVERELRGELFEVTGSDCAGRMELDYYRSLVPDKPAADTEFHLSAGTTPEEAASDLWSAMLHGEGMRQFYVWSYRYSAELMAAGAVLHNPPALEALGRATLDLRRLTPEVVAFQQAIPNAEVGLLYSPASLYCAADYPGHLRQAHALLSDQDAPVRFVSERQLAAGAFGRLKLVVVAGARHLEPATVAALERFLAAGGRVAATGTPRGWSDPYGNPLPPPAGVATLTELNADIATRLFDDAGIARPVRGRRGVELRSVPRPDGGHRVYAINYGDAIDFLPTVDARPLATARERIAEADLTFPVRLAPRQVLLLEVKP